MITWGQVAQLPNAFGEDASTLMEEQAATAAAWACSTPEAILTKPSFRRRILVGDESRDPIGCPSTELSPSLEFEKGVGISSMRTLCSEYVGMARNLVLISLALGC
jgi:hypothetical protein